MENNIRKSLGIFIFAILLITVSFTGCNLADKGLQDIKNGDKLIGIFVTFEEDLKDYTMQVGDTLYYEDKKLERADGTIKELTDEEFEAFKNNSTIIEGKRQKDSTYKFEELPGYYMGYSERIENDNGQAYPCTSSHCSSDIYNIHLMSSSRMEHEPNRKEFFKGGFLNNNNMELKNIVLDNSGDGELENILEPKIVEDSIKIEGTIGISSTREAQIRVNSVYQRKDGSVYTILPGSACLDIEADSAGGSISTDISESYQRNITGTGFSNESIKRSFAFKVTVEQFDFLKSANVRQMDKNNQLVKSTEVDLTKKEQELKLDKSTDYVIIDEHCIDITGKTYTQRTAYDCSRIGDIHENGHTEYVSHTFYKTEKNGKIGLVILSFKR